MGLCKCKKRTALFCFVHKKPVCEDCIVTDHKLCVVRTYLEWLQDSEFEPATCGVCKGPLTEDGSIRLLCLDLLHTRCVDAHVQSLPAHTANAGVTCPVCHKALLPAPEQTDGLARALHTHAAAAAWRFAAAPPQPSPAAVDPPGLAARGAPARPARPGDADDDKYGRRRGDDRLLAALLTGGEPARAADTPATPGPATAPPKRSHAHPLALNPHRPQRLLTPRRLLIAFAVFFTLATGLMMYWTLRGSAYETDDLPAA